MKMYKAYYGNGEEHKFKASSFFEAEQKARRHSWRPITGLIIVESQKTKQKLIDMVRRG